MSEPDYVDKVLREVYGKGYMQGGIDALEAVLALVKDSPHKYHSAVAISMLLKRAKEDNSVAHVGESFRANTPTSNGG